jgi:hypothetical protein
MVDQDKPFLPDAAPAEDETRKPHKRRAVLLWVIMMVTFLIVWNLLDVSSDKSTTPSSSASHSWTSSLALLLPMAFLAVLYLWFRRLTGRPHDFNRLQTPGFIALAEGRWTEAVSLLRATLGSFAKKSVYRSVAERNVGHAAMYAGMLDEAIASFSIAERGASSLAAPDVRALAAVDLAQAYALAGDVPTAQRWADCARTRLAKAMGSRLTLASYLCIAEALIALRAGRPAQALGLLEDNRLKLRYALTANTMRMAEVIAAFALAAAGLSATAGLRDQADVAARLARISPVLPQEFAYLGVRWPEFLAFLQEHQLAKAGPGGPS